MKIRNQKTRKMVSVIVPLYRGNKYVKEIIAMIDRNVHNLSEIADVELILVNDYPQEKIVVSNNRAISIKLFTNEDNKGIHFSRVYGLLNCLGEYVLFLDQDDIISDNFLVSQLSRIGNSDVIVSNGIVQYPNYNKLLYRFYFMQCTVKFEWFYTKFGCRIISPGQCLIKKESIPQEWTSNIIKNNGADDFYLWLLMLEKHSRFKLNRKQLYTHCFTAQNTSLDMQTMNASILEIISPSSSVKKQCKKRIEKNIQKEKKGLLIKMIEKFNRI